MGDHSDESLSWPPGAECRREKAGVVKRGDGWFDVGGVRMPGVGGLEATFVSRSVAPTDGSRPFALCSETDDRWTATSGRLIEGVSAR